MGSENDNQEGVTPAPRTVTADADGVRVAHSGAPVAKATAVGGQELTERSLGKEEEAIQHTVEGVDDFEKLLAESDSSSELGARQESGRHRRSHQSSWPRGVSGSRRQGEWLHPQGRATGR